MAGGERTGTLELEVPPAAAVPLRFLRRGSRYYVLTSRAGTTWAAHAARVGAVQVRTSRGGPLETRSVRLVTDPEEVGAVREGFVRALGPEEYARHFSDSDRVLALEEGSSPTPRAHIDRVVDEFDASVGRYESAIARSPFERYLKRRSLENLLGVFSGSDPLLEVGAGIGLETVPMLQAGHRITVVDVSSGMLGRLEARARESGVSDRLTTRRGRLASLQEDLAEIPSGAFRGAYSTFGAFDLEPDLRGVGTALGRVIAPGSVLFVAVLNRYGLAPLAYELMLGGPSQVRARLRRPVSAGSIRYPLDIYPRTPPELGGLLAPEFEPVASSTPSALLPPFESPRRFASLRPSAIERLRRVDRRLARSPVGPLLGEWSFLTFRRCSDGAGLSRAL